MITLCGMRLWNYYNKVKMVLLEKASPSGGKFKAPAARRKLRVVPAAGLRCRSIRTAQVCCARAGHRRLLSRRCSPSCACCRPTLRLRARLPLCRSCTLELAARELLRARPSGGRDQRGQR